LARNKKNIVSLSVSPRLKTQSKAKKEIRDFRKLKRVLHGVSSRQTLVYLEKWIKSDARAWINLAER
jgi:hypothetical protein